MVTLRALGAYGLSLSPMHPNRPTGPLASFFLVDAPTGVAASVREALRLEPDVEAVYDCPEPASPVA